MGSSHYHRSAAPDGGSGTIVADAERPEYDEGPEPHNPSLDEPWDPRAADALVRLYESGEARAALQSPLDDEKQDRLSHLKAFSLPTVRGGQPLGEADRDWLEARLAGITGEVQRALEAFRADPSVRSFGDRFDHFEKRFETAFARAATRTDVEGLKLIEAHVGELSERAAEAKGQLSRLLVIEAQVAELKASLSDERVSRLASAVAPTQQELTRIGTAAAETVVRRIAGQGIAGSESGKTRDLLNEFIEERRRSEQLAGEALETMQQAMQHILDRLDSIEMAQAALVEGMGQGSVEDDYDLAKKGGRYEAEGPLAATHVHAIGNRSTQAVEARQDRPIEELTLADLGPGRSMPRQSLTGDLQEPIMPDRKTASPFRSRGTSQEHKAEPKTFPGSGILLVAGLSAFMLAGYWLVSGIGIRAPLQTETQSAEARSRLTGQSHTVSLKPSSSEAIDPMRSEASAERAKSQMGQADGSQGNPDLPARTDQPTASGGRVVQAPMGMVIEQNPGSLSPEDIMRLRQRQRMANLSTRLGQQQALETGAASGEQGASISGASAPGREDTAGTVLEMPPITIGPQSLRIAAAKGDPSAQFDVAARFAEGKGVKQDFAQAAVWYQRAATQGFAAAQYRLAALYERGLGVTADAARARVWYKRAAEQGNLKAMHNMAVLSVGKDSTTSDYEVAAKWFTEAAEHGVTDSQYNLAVLLESGLGVPKDPTAAYRWYALAARGGDKEAARRMDRVKDKLSPATIKTIETEIAVWRPQPSEAFANDAHTAGEAWKTRASSKSD
jgi:localization factor PodJL